MHIPAFGSDIVQPVKGQIPGDPGQEMLQHPGNFRWNGIPCGQIRIRRDFLRILPVSQNVSGNGSKICPVLPLALRNRLLRTGEKQVDDFGIFQWIHSFDSVRSLHPYNTDSDAGGQNFSLSKNKNPRIVEYPRKIW